MIIVSKFLTGMESYGTSLERGDGEFNFPRCLLVNKSGQVMVCDSGNGRKQVFELNGKFVGKFEKKGKQLGKFSTLDPYALAVLSTGRFVFTDAVDHCIQLIE